MPQFLSFTFVAKKAIVNKEMKSIIYMSSLWSEMCYSSHFKMSPETVYNEIGYTQTELIKSTAF